MRIRHLAQHIKSQNWIAVGLDFLIVVFGVFLGLQAQQCNQQRMDRSSERIFISRLSSDFSSITDQLEQCLAVFEDSLEALRFVSRAIEQHSASASRPEPAKDELANALIRMTAGVIPAGRSATFVEMVSTGELKILRDSDLRNSLIAYDQRAEVNREVWRSIRDDTNAYGQSLYKSVDLSVDVSREEGFATILRYDLEAMASDPNFKTMLNVLAGAKGNNHELCRRQLELANEVIQRIAENR